LLEIGLVGLPNAGKSTLFNALTKAGADVGNYPFTTIEPNVGVVPLPDERFDRVVELIKPAKTVRTILRVVDIAGLVKGANEGEGLGNRFLGHIREVEAIMQVVRCFDDNLPDSATMAPIDDIEIINTELALADLATCEKRVLALAKPVKSGDKRAAELLERLKGLTEWLAEGKLAINFEHVDEFADLHLLTAKPMIFVANIGEDDLRSGNLEAAREVEQYARSHGAHFQIVSAEIETQLAELEADEAAVWRAELAMPESALNGLIRTAYQTLGLISFFTAGPSECRAWTVGKDAKAVEAAAVIHTDFARGFIKAEVIHYSVLLEDGGFNQARDLGHLRQEGKDYAVRDGDIIHFKFNV
jgi:ribosome-binding ATPase